MRVVKFEYPGVKLNLSMEVKYLGVILDDKLMRKTHVRPQVKKGLKVLWSCKAFIGRTKGLSLKMTLSLYKSLRLHMRLSHGGAEWTLLWPDPSWNACRRPHVL